MVVIVYDELAERDINLIECDSYEFHPDEEDEMHDIVFSRVEAFINHNAAMGLSSSIRYHSSWEIYINKRAIITEYENIADGKKAYFDMLIEEGYGGDMRNYLNNFFNDYIDDNDKLDCLEWRPGYIR